MNSIVLGNEVARACETNKPIVALESTLISHGLPSPYNLETAKGAEIVVRNNGAVPATIAVIKGQIRVGLTTNELEMLATSGPGSILKLSRNNLATAIAAKKTGATTVAATMICAAKAGINMFATGGIGGVHRGWQESLDISADLNELIRTPVTVVCSGAKSLLDLPATMEYLETIGVPIIGLGTNELPSFFSVESGFALQQHVSDSNQAAAVIAERRALKLEGGEIIAVPPPPETAVPSSEVYPWIETALCEAKTANIRGPLLTPFVLTRLQTLSKNRTLQSNIDLIKNNAKVAAEIAVSLKHKTPLQSKVGLN